MATLNEISIAEQARMILSTMTNWVDNLGGQARVVPNLKELWKQSAIDSQSLRVLICFGGARRRGSFDRASVTHREDRVWKVAVTKGLGYSDERGETLTESTGNTSAFLDEISTAVNLLRAIPNISNEGPTNDYEGIEPMQFGNLVMAGYCITFTTANDIPQPTTSGQLPL